MQVVNTHQTIYDEEEHSHLSKEEIENMKEEKLADQTVEDELKKKHEVEKFKRTIRAANRNLFRAKTAFPFDLFPDEIIIDENKVTIVYGIFFYTRSVFSIPLRNINGATSTNGLLLGELDIEIEGYNKNPRPIKNLWAKDARVARRVITGLVTAYKQNIDLTKLDLTKARGEVEDLGKSQESLLVS